MKKTPCTINHQKEEYSKGNQLKKEHKRNLRISGKVILANKQFIAKARYMEKEHKIMEGTASFTKVVYF